MTGWYELTFHGEERKMVKRLLVLAAALAAVFVAASPAMAQGGQYGGEYVTATGVVENFGSGVGDSSPYGLRDEATGGVYYLAGDFDFAAYEGQRVTATGTTEVVIRSVLLRVSSIEPAGTGGLPATGGAPLFVLVAGALLAGGGVVAYRLLSR